MSALLDLDVHWYVLGSVAVIAAVLGVLIRSHRRFERAEDAAVDRWRIHDGSD